MARGEDEAGEAREPAPFARLCAPFETAIPALPRAAPSPPPAALGAFLRWALAEAGPGLRGLALASLAVGAADAGVFWMIGALVDRAAAAGPERFFADNWGWLLAMLLVIAVFKPLSQLAQSGFSSLAVNPALFAQTVFRLHRYTLRQAMRFFEEDFTGRLAQKQMQTANALAQACVDTLTTLGMLVAFVVTMVAALTAADPRLALLAVGWLAGFGLVLARALPRIRRRAQARAEARARVTGQLVDSLGHIQTVKLFAHTGREEAAAARSLARFHAAAIDFGRALMAMRAMLAILNTVATLAMLALGLWLWSAGFATIGAVATAAMLTLRLTQMANWMAMSAMAVFGEIGTLEDGARTLSPPHGVTDRPGASEAPAPGPVRFENVTFRYGRPSGGVAGLDFTVAQGEKLALVGRSGAGKSTAVALLLRLHDVEAGRITIGGVDIRDMTQDGLRRMIGVVTQETAIFNRSALENIRYGRPEATLEEVAEAARRARADGFIAGLRDSLGREGYAAHLGERGVKLSGGQRQRIALARALLKDAPILVLDEATSALDSEVEAEIQAALREAMRGKTVLAIAHRLSTIAEMDRIVTLDAGRVIETGGHAELLARGGLYASLWARQSGGFLPLEAAE